LLKKGGAVSVDSTKTRRILAVHGVRTDRDDNIKCHEVLRTLIIDRLNNMPAKFEIEMYKYENINDAAQDKLTKVLDVFLAKLIDKVPFGKLLGSLIDQGIDLVGDVLIKLKEGTTAMVIRDGLIERIEQIYKEGNPLYIVSHSLGSIYAFDAVNELMKKRQYFDRESRRTWPVQALVTMGSPIGLAMFKRNSVKNMGVGRHYFRWINYWARTDPVVSGSFYGKPYDGYHIAERFSTSKEKCGWFIQDRVLDLGKTWLMAHAGYWQDPGIGDDLVTLILS
jgi:hypothetical protein